MEKKAVGHILYGHGDIKVIVLHSWMGDAQSWSSVIPFVQPERYTYAFMDVRGYGLSKEIPGIYNLDEIRNDIYQLAEALGFKTFNLVGHSMCGMVAQYTALKDPQNKINKVVLVTPVAASGFPANDESKEFFQSIVQNAEMTKIGYAAFTSQRYSDYWYSLCANRHVEVTNRKAQLSYMDMWLYENFIEEMPAVQKQFLIIAGKYDHPMFRLDVQKNNFKSFVHTEFIECDSGHFPMQEIPLFLASAIEKFLH